MRRFVYTILLTCLYSGAHAQSFFTERASAGSFDLRQAVIVVDPNEETLVKKSAEFLQQDIQKVTGQTLPLLFDAPSRANAVIFIGSVESVFLRKMEFAGKIRSAAVRGKWEAYQVYSLKDAFGGISNALVVMGSDRRGTAYGVAELSKQLGVSPWNWWADAPVPRKEKLYVKKDVSISDAPKVKYRGIFINDEAPALSHWSKEKFGGFNHLFYEKVFELMLRLKANYLWPAMWGNAFYHDDSLNIKKADEYGIVIGTSHHEPMMRAHEEWKYFGNGRKWNYDSTESGLKEFWKGGMQRAWNEKIVSVGMRGDGDEPMSRETATALLEKIVKDQRQIIADVTGKPASETPQLWALYKEVQDYYDKGMRVPGDMTLLLCDDNWGNIRKLPKPGEKPRKGGYGIYYHFDYVGGPRNYKWVNTNPLPRIWEQMHLAWEYNARQIWIVNVGDIKPMELPISFFLDYAWNPEKIGADDIQKYTETWAAMQFGPLHAKEIADILAKYAKYNSRRKPELLDDKTYSLTEQNEWARVSSEYKQLLKRAEATSDQLPPAYSDAYFQLVLHPVAACSNLNELYYQVALNKQYYALKDFRANLHADTIQSLYNRDSLITLHYHQLQNGKWDHMMSQTHIGYTYWQQPLQQKMPEIKRVPADSAIDRSGLNSLDIIKIRASYPRTVSAGQNIFYEDDYIVSMEAAHFTRAVHSKKMQWKTLPDHGRTGDAITSFPVTAPAQKPGTGAAYLEYEFYTHSASEFKANAYFSPTLNFHNTAEGLQYAISIDNGSPVILSINKDDTATGRGIWAKWVSENIIIKTSDHKIIKPGKHVLKYWAVNSGVVLQKIVLEFGTKPRMYLGPVETIVNKK